MPHTESGGYVPRLSRRLPRRGIRFRPRNGRGDRSLMCFSRGDIVRLDLDPSHGREQTKRRYAVVVSNDWYNTHCNLTMICPITSTDSGYPLHIELGEWRISAQDVDVDTIHGFIQVEQLKALDLNARQALYVGRLDDAPGMSRNLPWLSDVIAGSSSMNHYLPAAGIGLQVGRATASRSMGGGSGLLTVRRLDPRPPRRPRAALVRSGSPGT